MRPVPYRQSMMAVLAVSVLVGAAPAAAFSVKVDWGPSGGCSATAPAFAFAKVPKGTAQIRLSMVDLDLPSYPHGGGTTAYSGVDQLAPGQAFGMFSGYRGPCPPQGTSHRYQWTAEAFGADGTALGTARTVLPYKR